MRVLNALMLLAFLLSAGVQLNDPDPVAWIAAYLAAAGACLAWERHRLPRPVALGLAAGALLWSVALLVQVPDETALGPAVSQWQMKGGGEELVREVGGLWLITAWSAVLGLVRRS